MKKCAKVKNPCRICFQPVTAKNGLRCLGACKKWAHFKCLDYTPGKIQDIKAGLIKVNCPCPDCDNDFKEVQTNKAYNCNKQECPANEELICDSDACPKKLCANKSTEYVFNCPDDCPSPEGSGDECNKSGKKGNKNSCPPTCPPPCSPPPCPPPSCPPQPCPPPPCPPPPCPPPPCPPPPCPPPSCEPSPPCFPPPCEPSPPLCPRKRCSPPRGGRSSPPRCPRPKSPPCPPPPCSPPPCPPSKCQPQKVYAGSESTSYTSLHMRTSGQSLVNAFCQGSPADIPRSKKRSGSPPKGNNPKCSPPNRPTPCTHACCPSNQCPPKPCPPRPKPPKPCPKKCLDELQNACSRTKCKQLDLQSTKCRPTRQPSYLTGSRSSCSGLNTEEPSHNRCMSDPSLSADPRRMLVTAMNQMCTTVGEFQTQFRELMSKMMNALDRTS